MFSKDFGISRRDFISRSGWSAAAGVAALRAIAQDLPPTIKLPFENGERPLVKYPQKRALIRHTTRPPQLETPFEIFNEGPITPNDAFFVRYHLAASAPPAIDPDRFELLVDGEVERPLRLSLKGLKELEPVEIVAVNQCSGNSRGFFNPRVQGGQLGNGAMGNARWRGVRLKEVLAKAGLRAGAVQVTFDGLDGPIVPKTPDFVKALEVDHALDDDTLLAYEMNGEPLPVLNGFPLRLVVPGHYGTYWVKHLNHISVLNQKFDGYWMNPAYRIPDNTCACVTPGAPPKKTVPIMRYNVRSFMTSVANGFELKSGKTIEIKGIAFDGGYGIQEVLFSADDGRTWREAVLGQDLGRFSFRPWSVSFSPDKTGEHRLKVKATNRIGQSQPLEPLWNPAGYMRNVVETITVNVIS